MYIYIKQKQQYFHLMGITAANVGLRPKILSNHTPEPQTSFTGAGTVEYYKVKIWNDAVV